MTDISNWPQTVHIMRVRERDAYGTGNERLVERIMVPLNPYQMGNLIDALAQSTKNGDWYGEVCAIIAVAMRVAGLKELGCNRGFTYTLDQIADAAL